MVNLAVCKECHSPMAQDPPDSRYKKKKTKDYCIDCYKKIIGEK